MSKQDELSLILRQMQQQPGDLAQHQLSPSELRAIVAEARQYQQIKAEQQAQSMMRWLWIGGGIVVSILLLMMGFTMMLNASKPAPAPIPPPPPPPQPIINENRCIAFCNGS